MAELNKKEAEQAYQIHRSYCGNWQEGKAIESWLDGSGYLCIRYESGKWWHYREKADGSLEWW